MTAGTPYNAKTVTKRECDAKCEQCQSDAIVGRAAEIREASGKQFRLQLTPEGRQYEYPYLTEQTTQQL